MPNTISDEREHVWALYREHGTVEAVASALDKPRSEISLIIDQMPLRQIYRRKGIPPRAYTKAELKGVLKEAAQICGEPLTLPAYHKEAPKNGWPAALTITQAFGTWEVACHEAGVAVNASTGPRRGSISVEDCLIALRTCRADLIDTGEIPPAGAPSYERYVKWAKANHKPSGPTVRVKIGPWRTALRMAYGEE